MESQGSEKARKSSCTVEMTLRGAYVPKTKDWMFLT